MLNKSAFAWAIMVGLSAVPNAHADSFETAYAEVLPLFKKCIPQTDATQEYLADQGARMTAAFSEGKKLDLELFKKSYSETCDLKQSLKAGGFDSDKGKAQVQSEAVAQKCDAPVDRKAHVFEVKLTTTKTVRDFEYPTSIGRFEPNSAAYKQCKDAGLYDCIEVDIQCENPTYLGIPFVGGRESRTCTSKVRGYELPQQPVCVPAPQAPVEAKPAAVEAKPADASKNVAPPDLTDVAKNADGSVLHLNQYDADSYCRNQGQRLPTARELGLYAQSLGAEGIIETEKDGFLPVNGSDSAGHPDNFYYSFFHYRRAAGDSEANAYWSSSVDPEHSNVALAMNNDMGVILGLNREFAGMGAVRCVQSR